MIFIDWHDLESLRRAQNFFYFLRLNFPDSKEIAAMLERIDNAIAAEISANPIIAPSELQAKN